MITTFLFDDADGVAYTLSFSEDDAKGLLALQQDQTLDLNSIGGNARFALPPEFEEGGRDKSVAICYNNGRHRQGFIYTDFTHLCEQLEEGLEEIQELN